MCTGKATKQIDRLQAGTKEYVATLQLGQTTPSYDLETQVDATYPTDHITLDLIHRILPRFMGRIEQIPPAFSAVKIDGHRAYNLARKGGHEEVEKILKPKVLVIDELEVVSFDAPTMQLTLRVVCSKGTYIRVLLEEIAEAMGQKGTMSALRRVAAGVYTEADAHSLEEIQAAKNAGPEALQALMLPVESVFTSLPLLVADERVEQHLYNGCPTSRYPAADGRYRVRNAQGQFLGLANVTGGVLRVEKLFVERN